ncbi:MAG: hypothetical protein NHB32_08690 [Fischerella sp. CENA71]|nr:hypothetical protein [Fischerella sp. CENA71]
MYRRTQQRKANGDLRMQFGINPKTCQKCSLKRRCLAPNTKGKGGRRVTVIRRKQAQAQETFPICSAIILTVRAIEDEFGEIDEIRESIKAGDHFPSPLCQKESCVGCNGLMVSVKNGTFTPTNNIRTNR